MRRSTESGSVLLDAFMSLLLGSIVITSALASFSNVWTRNNELRIKAELYTEARLILDMLAFDLRMTGAGMPLGQAQFTSSDPEINEFALPIVPTSDETEVTIRLNELGVSTLTTDVFTPASGDNSVQVVSTNGFAVGDTVYISDMPAGGTAGVRARISSISGNILTFSSPLIPEDPANFPTGSIVEPVKQITYSHSSEGITRDDGSGPILIAPGSSFRVRYMDEAGQTVPLPLTSASIEQTVSSINIDVELRATSNQLNSTTPYTTTTSQTVALRNVNLSR